MTRKTISASHQFFIALLLIFGLTACGSGGGGGSSSGTISGKAIKGPISEGKVKAYAVTSGAKGFELGTASTDSKGNYSINIGSYSGLVFLEITEGSYIDEVSGTLINLPTVAGSGLQAVVSNVAAGSNLQVQITPLTTMAAARSLSMSGGLTTANIDAANQEVGAYFRGIDILNTQPVNPLVFNSAVGATQGAIDYGLILAGFSQEAQTLRLTNRMDLISALAKDFSDGIFDGKSGSTLISLNGSPIDPAIGTANLATAINTFSSSSANVSGGTVSSSLIDSILNSTHTYTIGGMISGLTGTGLVLQNNGGDDHGISSNGSFTFSAALASGNVYDVSVFIPPSGQDCTVANGSGAVGSANINNVSVSCVADTPTANTFSPTGNMRTARSAHTATLLSGGKVLIAGGDDSINMHIASAELYDPAVGIFSPTGSMIKARINHTAILLLNGKVLIVGGGGNNEIHASAELYDPDTGTFSLTRSMAIARTEHTATLLPNGKVLIAGGAGKGPTVVASAELFQ